MDDQGIVGGAEGAAPRGGGRGRAGSPLERRVTALLGAGMPIDEVSRRFRRGVPHIEQVARLATLPGRSARSLIAPGLRPIERRLLRWRDQGVEPDELAGRFRRSADHLRRVEVLARYKLARTPSEE